MRLINGLFLKVYPHVCGGIRVCDRFCTSVQGLSPRVRGHRTRAGLPEVWIVNLDDQQIEVHRNPDGDVYRTRHLTGLDDTVTPERPAPIGTVPVRDILGDLPEPENDIAEP